MAPVGALKASLLEDFKAPRPAYLSEEELNEWKATFLRNGFAAPLCWYKIETSGLQAEDDQGISTIPTSY